MLTDEQRVERDPVAIQQELLAIEAALIKEEPEFEAARQAYHDAQAKFECEKYKIKFLKQRAGVLQSVLKSLPRE